ncbi:MAG: histidine phosphatase family protein [Anaerolineales bacterium]|nr:histidine phosphatase family protein [Anaerolineales bacterium]
MQLYFIRHGQSINNANSGNASYTEHSDPFLTELGIQQAEHLADYFKGRQEITDPEAWNNQNQFGFGLTQVYSSLMERAVHTAAFTVRALGNVPFTAWPEIHEQGGMYVREQKNRFTGLPGKPRSFFEKNYPELELPEAYDESGWWNRPFEDDEARQPRADRVLSELIQRHGDRSNQPEERIAFVSHGGFFVRLIASMLKLPWRQGAHNLKFWFPLNNCSISRFDLTEDELTIQYINRTEHLPAHLITG